jgi:hypothetical protein
VLGQGIVLQFRRSFVDNDEAYRKAAKQNEVLPGQMFIVERSAFEQPRWLVNFPTKRHWKGVEKVHGWKTRKVMFTPYQIQAISR